MKFAVVAPLQALTAPDPAQMEKVPDLGYTDVPHGFRFYFTLMYFLNLCGPTSAA
jgi:hypothetical protein